ncbi:MAG TPA: hypothetical protein VMI06_04320 [Terriglobia bacterium]|nr:hypothetical protein [Terriglobia bacterium]
MSSRDQLHSYLRQVEKRLRLSVLLQGATLLTSVALLVTVLLVLLSNAFAFSQESLAGARVVLFLALAAALGLGLALPLYALNRRRAADRAEAKFPQFQQRLITFVDRDSPGSSPFIELLAADTLQLACKAEPAQLAPDRKLLLSVAAGSACLGVLIWMIVAGPGFLGYGAKRLWAGSSRSAAPFYSIRVSPGDVAVRRNSGQVVTAQLLGFQSPEARLYARYQSSSKWQEATMQPQSGASAFQFIFTGIPEDVHYYVQAGRVQSRNYKIHVLDLPSIKQMLVTYHYPSWTGLKNAVQDRGGDLRAVKGTAVDIAISTDRPMRGGDLVLNSGQKIALSGGEGNTYRGAIAIEKDGGYHVAAVDQGQLVRLSDDFLIEASKLNPPEVSITRLGRDYQASPIEEVTVSVRASDDYGLNGVNLHYSVNGGPARTVNILRQKGAKEIEGSTLLYLENFKVVPGDVVSVYATAKDAKAESRTGMFFVEVQPFERAYSQSQLAGSGGLGNQQSDLSQREKEIIAATWNQQGDEQATPQQASGNGKFLSGVQGKLRDQVLWLTGRMQEREMGDENNEFSAFQQDMTAAARAMGPASKRLAQQQWTKAISSEERALQQLLRAEATFRQIQVAFGSQGGGGGAGAGRDLANLMDLELNTQKNQYETGQSADSARQRAQDADKAFQKLDELAHREQELAQEQRNNPSQSFQQRWQQDMLHRQAEQLQKQLEQLAASNSQGPKSSSASGSQESNGASTGATGDSLQRIIDQLRQASKDMDRAASRGEESAADARRAASALEEARSLMDRLERQQVSPQLNSLAREADRLAGQEHDQAARIRQIFPDKGQPNSFGQPEFDGGNMSQSKLADQRQLLANNLSRLEKAMQAASRDLASTQPQAAAKLHKTLGEMDQAELQSRLERSAESIRYGFNPDSKTLEPAITAGIEHLREGIREAQQALTRPQQDPVEEALNRIQRLRNNIETLARPSGNANETSGQPGAQSQGRQDAQDNQQGQPGQRTQGNQGSQNGNVNNGFQSGSPGGPRSWKAGPVTGMGTYIQPQGSEPSSDGSESSELALQAARRQLNGLRRQLRSEPGLLPDIQTLTRDLQRLGAGNFPGNPALTEQLRDQALSSMDRLELQLRRELDNQQSGEIRNGDSLHIPPGYQEPVATYFRRLSKNP